MLFKVATVILAALLPVFFLFGFSCGAKKAHNPVAPIMPKVRKTKQSEEQKKLDTISRNIANYVGNSEGQERI